ncbi:MAG: chitobiase/beta-hexosaminidase C-terminal domain-containing protein, partial [Muribaculaceae bacterium]|nr:chitobiase/beta-hexosaminidase C-terminal domain-containing protein [Muribaculaceae bacterium]
MKKSIIVMGISALLGMGMTTRADEPGGTGHTTEVTPGDWDDDDPKLKFEFQDIPQASFAGLRLTLSCGLPDAHILYTTDAKADPKDTNAWTQYTEPLELKEDCTVRFFARCEGYDDSDIQTYTFVYADHQASAPTVAPDIDRKNIVMTTETPNAVIRYTFDGGDPDESSLAYEGPVALTANGIFRSRSFADDMFPSVVYEYAVDFLKAETPSAVFEDKHLVLASGDADAKFHYTFSESPVSDQDAWSMYSAPIALSEDCTVRFYASRDGHHDSEVGSFSFFFSAYQVAAPMLTADAEGTHVVMECETEGAEIRYTTDGSEPTVQSSLYTEPVEIISNGTFRARAFKEGLFDS